MEFVLLNADLVTNAVMVKYAASMAADTLASIQVVKVTFISNNG